MINSPGPVLGKTIPVFPTGNSVGELQSYCKSILEFSGWASVPQCISVSFQEGNFIVSTGTGPVSWRPGSKEYNALSLFLLSPECENSFAINKISLKVNEIECNYLLQLPGRYLPDRGVLISLNEETAGKTEIKSLITSLAAHLNSAGSSAAHLLHGHPDLTATLSSVPAPFLAFVLPDGEFIPAYCNNAFSSLLKTEQSLQNKLINTFLLAATGETITDYIKHKGMPETLIFPGKVFGNKKNETWVELSLTLTSFKGKQAYFGTAQNITAHMSAEWQMRDISSRISSLLQNLQAGIILEDENRHIVTVNQELCSFFKLPFIPEELVGVYSGEIEKFIITEALNRGQLRQRLYEIMHNRTVVKGEEVELVDGRFVEIDYIPVFITDEYKGHFWQYRDVTERKKREEELKHAKVKAEESNLVKEEFLAHISHEIRTPLNAIIGLTKILIDLKPGQRELKYLGGVRVAADTLLGIINEILDFSKIRAGKLEFTEAPFNIREVCKELQEMLHLKAEEKGLSLEFEIADSVHKPINGDRGRLFQVLTNLLTNAIKFTASGSVKTSISISAAENKDMCIAECTVVDTGTGIPAENLEYIFESFSQLKNQAMANTAGTGLGLPITKKLIELQGGSISVTSEPGKGSAFKFIIPYKIGAGTEKPKVKTQKKADLQNVHILIAEDNELNIMVVTNYLKQWGVTYEIAGNGVEAVEKCGLKKFDVILMDLSMPLMDGFQASSAIRMPGNKNTDTPIVALSAAAIFDIQTKAAECGINAIIPKPFKSDELYAGILSLTIGKTVQPAQAFQTVPVSEKTPSPEADFLDGILERMKEFFGGDENDIKEFLGRFIEQNDVYMKDFSQFLNTGNYKSLEEQAHRMRSPFSYAGLVDLAKKLADIESAIKSGKSEDAFIPQAEEVEQQWQSVRDALLKLT